MTCWIPRRHHDRFGTFQAYVYGDVEVGVEEIVTFNATSALTSRPCSTCSPAQT